MENREREREREKEGEGEEENKRNVQKIFLCCAAREGLISLRGWTNWFADGRVGNWMSIRVARNETSGWVPRVSSTRSRRAKVADVGRQSTRSVGRGNAVPDKRERQSRAISKRPITGERSELERKKIARENRDSFGAERMARGWTRKQ